MLYNASKKEPYPYSNSYSRISCTHSHLSTFHWQETPGSEDHREITGRIQLKKYVQTGFSSLWLKKEESLILSQNYIKSDTKAIYFVFLFIFANNSYTMWLITEKSKRMKNTIFIGMILSVMLMTSCTSTNGKKNEGVTHGNELKEESSAVMPGDNDGKVITLTRDLFLKKVWDFEKNPDTWVYKGDKPCIIDFYADWCKPCRMVAPIMDELAQDYKGKVYVYKINTQVERELAQVFQVTSIPRVLFCPMQGKPQMSVGALPKPSFVQAINDVLMVK
jgi:thioredoxin